MELATLELVGGIIIVLLTLRDVFDTVVVPGAATGGLRVTRRIVRFLRPIRLRSRLRGSGIPTSFGPLVLVGSFVIWMVLLAFGFGMVAHALRRSFDPPLQDFAQAVYLVGSGLVTIGLSETDALAGARWVVLASGFCGLAVMTMAVTYLLEVQSSIADRDKGILKLQTVAGDPPSAIGLLERLAALEAKGLLHEVLTVGRDWCAAVRQSHTAHPALIYFRTRGTGAGWPATLGTLIDLALIIECLMDEPELRGRAILLREDGARLSGDLCTFLKIEVVPSAMEKDELGELVRRLSDSGYRASTSPRWEDFAQRYARCSAPVAALARHLGEEAAPLLPLEKHV